MTAAADVQAKIDAIAAGLVTARAELDQAAVELATVRGEVGDLGGGWGVVAPRPAPVVGGHLIFDVVGVP